MGRRWCFAFTDYYLLEVKRSTSLRFLSAGNRDLGLLGPKLGPSDVAADPGGGASSSGTSHWLQKWRYQEAATVTDEQMIDLRYRPCEALH